MAEQSKQNVPIKLYIDGFDKAAICSSLNRITGSVFKLLPMREEEQEYVKPLETLYLELLGLCDLLQPQQEKLLMLVSKMNGLRLEPDMDFAMYRRTIFECCGLLNDIKQMVQE